MFISLLTAMYLVYVMPFDTKQFNYVEIFNELCILAASHSGFLFGDFIEDPDIKYNVGWALIGITCLNILVNAVVLIIAYIQSIRAIVKYIRQKCKRKNNQTVPLQ